MFKRSNLLFIISVAIAGVLAGCDKELQEDVPATLTGEGYSYIRVIHASPTFRSVVTTPGIQTRDSFNLYVSGAKVNSSFLTYNSMFPGQTTGYIAVTSGLHYFRLTLNGVKTADSATLHTFQKVLEPGQRYSYILTDSIRSSNENRQMLLKDNFNNPVPGNYAVRFVHAVMNDTVGKTVDVYSFRRKANIFTNIKIGDATGFVEYGPSGTDTLSVRRNGTTWELTRLNSIPFASGRVYTVIYRGLTSPLPANTRPRGAVYYQNN